MTAITDFPEAVESALNRSKDEYRIRHLALADYELPAEMVDSVELQANWYRLLQQHCFPDRDCKVLELAIGEQLVGALPYMVTSGSALNVPIRTLEGITGLYTSVYAPVIGDTEHDPREVLARLLIELLALPGWDVIELGPMNESSHVNGCLQQVCQCLGLLRQCEPQFGNWFLRHEQGSFAEYLGQRPGQLRSTLKRKGAILEREHRSRIAIFQQVDELDTALADYETVYANSWKTEEFSMEFIRQLCRWCADMGWLRLGILYIDEVPAAAQIWFVLNGQAAIFKLAYDESYKAMSAGSILTAQLMQHVMEVDGVNSVDFGKGDESYKADWMSGVEARVSTRIFNGKTFRGRIAWLRRAVLPALKYRFRGTQQGK